MKNLLVIYLTFFVINNTDANVLDILQSSEKSITKGSAPITLKDNRLKNELQSRLGSLTPEMNIFFELMNSNKFEKALFQFDSAFKNANKGDEYYALKSFLFIKNDLPVTALENLFLVKNPKNLPGSLQQMIKMSLKSEHPSWNLAQINWNNNWNGFFNQVARAKVLISNSSGLVDAEKVLSWYQDVPEGSEPSERLVWRLAVSLALKGDLEKSVKLIGHLLKEGKGFVSKDLLNITASRMLFQSGYLQASIDYLKRVKKKSDYWFVAQEEAAWAYIRKGESQNVLAITKSFTNKNLHSFLGPESFYLRSIAQLKLCDYHGVLETLKTFSTVFKAKAVNLQTAMNLENNEIIEKIFTGLTKGHDEISDFRKDSIYIPRYLPRDQKLFRLISSYNAYTKESVNAGNLYKRSLSGGSDVVGYQSSFEYVKKDIQTRMSATKSAVFNLIRNRMDEEVKEISAVLQKMHIVEAELIQQVEIASTESKVNLIDKETRKGSTGSTDKYALKFPFNGESWFDEVANYRVNVKSGCTVAKN